MQKLYIEETNSTPEIKFYPSDNIFIIKGTSSPEDVRALYYPVIEWIKIFVNDVLLGEYPSFNNNSPIKIQTNLEYFNSSSAKFLFDIFSELKRVVEAGVPVVVEWYYDQDDPDQKEAGNDIATLVGMDFTFVPKS